MSLVLENLKKCIFEISKTVTMYCSKMPQKTIIEKSVFNEAVAMLTLSDSKNFRFCYDIYNRNVIIMMEQKLPNLIQTYQQPK